MNAFIKAFGAQMVLKKPFIERIFQSVDLAPNWIYLNT